MVRFFLVMIMGWDVLAGMLTSMVTLLGMTSRSHIRGFIILDEVKIVVGVIDKFIGVRVMVEFDGVLF